MDLTLAWAAIIALGLFLYVVLDGFDLGIGILFPFFPDQHDRDVMMNTVAPVWDGNETWLVLGGAGLFAAFPMVYSTVLSALYLPLVLMLVCLIFRGVSFEIRAKAQRTKHLWDLAFIGGSAGATFFQGVALGAFLGGIPVADGRFSGDAFGWFTPFSIFTGGALVVTYALLGACWLIAKTEGDLQRRMYRVVWPLTVLQLATIAVVSIWTPLLDASIASRWFDSPLFYRLLPVPLLVIACAWAMRRSIRSRHEKRPFAVALGFVLLGYAGLVGSISPHEIFPGVSIWDAAAPRSSQLFTIVGAAVILPVIVAYTTLGYWVFRGKVRHGEHHYH
ncbi:cytochrome d ubiquinol oxidase subunit II [Caballeronia ptereochthonis]|uniref:Cytochrome oxidase subunit II n=1 Tax=Caballeronia ptereochthonis TaxID=1777144 RepID=A0A157ZNS4_9BURK|nr:cytochrome d ubiquinol oxidase subunit II [Caballeronia ptereochthonis]SAK47141.1 cytochrome oxidase subunit II [Caballeronia ptereochthonis]